MCVRHRNSQVVLEPTSPITGCTTRQELKSPIKQINELPPKWCPVPFFAFVRLLLSPFLLGVTSHLSDPSFGVVNPT